MQIIDTHAHIYLSEFDNDRDGMLKRAAEQGVGHILMPAVDASTHGQMLLAEAQWHQCIAMMGVHPCSVGDAYKAELLAVKTHLQARKFVAVGEVGLDFYWDTTFKMQQYDAFATQIQWAVAKGLPLVIHSRNAMQECIEVVSRHPGAHGVFHCFSGTLEQARQIMDLGFHLGIGGVLTYKKAGLDKVMESIGLDAVVLETDAPYLAPVPYRGKRNESSYLPLIAERLATIAGCSLEEVTTVTTQNAKRLFNLT
jgi:TatD DNase family protein